jgi:Bacterial Ig-like domain
MTLARWRMLMAVLAVSTVGACTDSDSATDLNPEGPPMLEQVRLTHRVTDAANPTVTFPLKVFAFGSHPLASPDEVVPNVTTAVPVGNSMRLIVDEILVGNNLEEIQCRSTVDSDTYQRVPLGATPDDIARCSVADDVLASSCGGSTAVCLCDNPTGCLRGLTMVGQGEPVGVLDANQDGATDDTQFIDGAVGLQCGTITVPIDLQGSYWNPSGTQNKPAQGGFDALGPAIVLQSTGPLPTNLQCNLTFSPTIVDKENRALCAPAGGDVKAGCVEGDTSAFTFHTEPLTVSPSSWADNDTGVNRVDPAFFSTNTPVSAASVTGTVTVKENGVTFTGFTVTLMNPMLVQVTWTAQLAANATYVVTFSPSLTDTFAQPLPAPTVLTFTTGS